MERGTKLQVVVGALLFGSLIACNAISGAGDLGVTASATKAKSGKTDADVEEDDEDTTPKDTGSDAGAPPPEVDSGATQNPTFTDDFARANGTVGNGWVERTPGAFGLNSGAVQQGTTGPVPNMLVLRPAGEDVANVEVSVLVKMSGQQDADPGLVARVQPTGTNQLSGYNLSLGGPAVAFIDRGEGDKFSELGSFALSPAIAAGDVVRMVFKVTGDNPVKLEASVVDANNVVRGSTMITDPAPNRITAAGSVGFGGTACVGARYDDFKRVTLLSF